MGAAENLIEAIEQGDLKRVLAILETDEGLANLKRRGGCHAAALCGDPRPSPDRATAA
jgi:hypothetical protein